MYDELPNGAEILLPQSRDGYYATRGTIAALQRLSRDDRFTPGAEGIVKYEDKDGSIKEYKGTSFIKAPRAAQPANITEQQETKIQVLKDLSEKMNNKFDVSLRTSSHYFEWVGTGENRRLKLWHRLHDEIGSHFKEESRNKKNWSNQIKELYSVVYHNGYSQTSPDGNKDIQALLNRLRNFYETEQMNELLLDKIEGYVKYL